MRFEIRSSRMRRAAGMTEYIVVVSLVAVLLLTASRIYGANILRLFRGAVTSLQRGNPRALQVSKHDTPLAILTDGHLGNPAGSTNAEREEDNAVDRTCPKDPNPNVQARQHTPFFGFDETEIAMIRNARRRLPEKIRGVPLAGFRRFDKDDTGYVADTNQMHIGGNALHPDSTEKNPDNHDPEYGTTPGANDLIWGLMQDDPGYSLERLLYHEGAHAYDNHNSEKAREFTGLAYDGKVQRFKNDPDVVAVLAEKQRLAQAGRNHGADPEWRQTMDDLSRLSEQHGLPSRFRGDAHAADNPSEHFAMSLETARYDPARFQRWRDLARDSDPSNDVLTPGEVNWIDANQDLWKN